VNTCGGKKNVHDMTDLVNYHNLHSGVKCCWI